MAVMRGGKVLQIGSPLEVYERPADLFVLSSSARRIFYLANRSTETGFRLMTASSKRRRQRRLRRAAL